jgi:signal transduction histidine kinase
LVAWAAASLAFGLFGEWAYARAGASRADVLRDLSVGWAFAAAGLVAWWRRPANNTGRLMAAEGLTWFLGNLQGTGVPLLFAAGAWGEAVNLAVLAHLVLAFPEGRLTTRLERRAVAAAYALVVVGGFVRAATYDPAVDSTATYLACPGCGPNALLLYPHHEAFRAVDLVYRVLGAVLILVCTAALVGRWRRSVEARRRVLVPVWITVAIAIGFVGEEGLYILPRGFFGRGADLLVLLTDLSQVAVPLAFLTGLLRARLRRAAVGNLVIEVGADPTPRRMQEVLARVLGDPTLRFGLREGGGWSDPESRPLRLPRAGGDRSATVVHSLGEPSAVIVHDAALDDDPQLLAAVAASVRLCLENTRLRSEVTARTQEARAAGARLIEAAERERRRLERDLHDGAQTRLVLALMTLRKLDAGLAGAADPALRRTVAETDRTLRLALDDLRRIAHGIHPAVLTRDGLGPAVTALAEQAEIPVVVAVEPGRYPPLVEATAYYAVCEALSNAAKHAGARAVSVHARRDGGRLVVEATDDGTGGADPGRGTGLVGLADRLAAVGGTLHVHSPAGGGTRIRAELPCE